MRLILFFLKRIQQPLIQAERFCCRNINNFVKEVSKKPFNVNSFCQRTYNCGELRLTHIGELVQIYGWLSFKRLNKFLVLRDSYGYVQVTVPDHRQEEFNSIIDCLHFESVLRVYGKVLDRGCNQNKKMKTGEIEIELIDFEVLNEAPSLIPINLNNKINESLEFTRLQYRYLDMRSFRMQHNLRLRSKILHSMRRFLIEDLFFVDVETPTLSQWTPGGATEFVVPAPKPNLGQFYTLPQSPQIYKQLLMCGGIDRYFQIARCYRNEGSKTDRQPEFTQVDLELSFVTQDDIIALIESLIIASWPIELEKYKPKTPFPKMVYANVLSKYNTDKPDLRTEKSKNPFEFLWVVDFPLFTRNKETKALESTHHPFTSPIKEHLNYLKQNKNLENITAQHYDLVMNGVELGGGSIRIHNSMLQRHVLTNILKLPINTLEHFLEALSFGAPPHGGFALGLDRYVALLADQSLKLVESVQNLKPNKLLNKNSIPNLGKGNEFISSIRDVIAFPKTNKGRCLTINAPSKLPLNVYEEYGIEIKNKID